MYVYTNTHIYRHNKQAITHLYCTETFTYIHRQPNKHLHMPNMYKEWIKCFKIRRHAKNNTPIKLLIFYDNHLKICNSNFLKIPQQNLEVFKNKILKKKFPFISKSTTFKFIKNKKEHKISKHKSHPINFNYRNTDKELEQFPISLSHLYNTESQYNIFITMKVWKTILKK